MNPNRSLVAVAGLAMTVLAVAGCSNGSTDESSPSSPTSVGTSAESAATTESETAQASASIPTAAVTTYPDSTGHPETTQPETTQPETTHAVTTQPETTGVETTRPSDPDACSTAAAGPLARIAEASSIAYQLVTPVVFDRVDCAGTAAVGHTAPDGVHQPTGVLFVHDNSGWIAVGVGSAMDCVALGARPEDASRLEGCL